MPREKRIIIPAKPLDIKDISKGRLFLELNIPIDDALYLVDQANQFYKETLRSKGYFDVEELIEEEEDFEDESESEEEEDESDEEEEESDEEVLVKNDEPPAKKRKVDGKGTSQ
jgi:Ran GTPase-activating protein (RanGAP) involved in mRNA processing and transport